MTTELQNELELGRIHQGDCLDILAQMKEATVDLVFADPPFNIGYEYDEYHDKQEDDQYLSWSAKWMAEVSRILKPNGTFWLAIGDEYAAELKLIAKDLEFSTRSWVVWYYTFGVNCTKKFSRSHVHLFHFVKDESNFTFNSDDAGVRVPSARATVYADKRANPTGRLPDDTWILRPQDLPEGFEANGDTWYFPRIAGTFSERQGFHGCQMPEQLLGRIIRVSSNPHDLVVDPFAGSGTTLAVAKKLARRWFGCELSEEYVRAGTDRLNAISAGAELNGSANPNVSAPSTSNGRKLLQSTREDSFATVPKEINGSSDASTKSLNQALNSTSSNSGSGQLRDHIHAAIEHAFYATNDGYSSDWLLADSQIQTSFHEACRDAGLIGSPVDWNRSLMRLRKSGKFRKADTLKRVQFSDAEMDIYRFAAEIAWRSAREKFDDVSLDEIFCDPTKSAHFDRVAKAYITGLNPAGCRWAALRLRKASKDLVGEMKQYHFMYKSRDFQRRPQRWDLVNADRFIGCPGLYMLQAADRTPLFVDMTLNLGDRFLRHRNQTAASKAVSYLSLIPSEEMPGPDYNGGLKLHLVKAYDPCFNVNLAGLVEASAI